LERIRIWVWENDYDTLGNAACYSSNGAFILSSIRETLIDEGYTLIEPFGLAGGVVLGRVSYGAKKTKNLNKKCESPKQITLALAGTLFHAGFRLTLQNRAQAKCDRNST
jgi:hypothetical protein